ncbi:ribonuclease P protein component [Usitatibacter palustris]|uniref:Ribonuclease P protein component n=1 Tax=Usitatibacter palustris TaxID=2732487 RepID=A0A6M4HBK3_9PROT|nr:ribonuclease P protein component [Usitatibacter palustris]QJR16976.1 Ribonuclease P protein component [Usitatibacter palustris]
MSRGARKEGLSRRHRFTAQGSFGPALRSPRKARGTRSLVHVLAGRPGVSRLGIALSRRVAPSSVHRNRIKRVVRELFRRHGAKAAGLDLVVAFRDRVDKVSSGELAREISGLLDQALEKAPR